jgi:hypothetical protein
VTEITFASEREGVRYGHTESGLHVHQLPSGEVVPSMWPWIYGSDEGAHPQRIVSRATHVWPTFIARQVDIAEYMKNTGAEFWEACAIVLADPSAFHVCPKCGHGWPDPRVAVP